MAPVHAMAGDGLQACGCTYLHVCACWTVLSWYAGGTHGSSPSISHQHGIQCRLLEGVGSPGASVASWTHAICRAICRDTWATCIQGKGLK
jgi:hypothetical protein